ncbi:hypothetical protein IG631_06014 [Alternaria alternata]|nr:hypothetical protein IG631_06014 [Alternaria alternata]
MWVRRGTCYPTIVTTAVVSALLPATQHRHAVSPRRSFLLILLRPTAIYPFIDSRRARGRGSGGAIPASNRHQTPRPTNMVSIRHKHAA